MKKLIIGSFSLLFASIIAAPAVRAQTETDMMTETGTTKNVPATHIEKLRQQTNGRYYPTDSQVEQQGTGMGDEQQPSTQTEQLQQQTGTEGTYPTQPGQSGTGMGDEQQPSTQTEQLQQQTETENTYPTQQAGDYETEAFSLVRSAYRGELEPEIPSYNELVRDYGIGQVTAEDLVKAAIEADMVAPEVIEDEAYLNAVQLQLDALSSTR